MGSGLATAPLPPAARGPGPTWPSLRRGRATPEAGVIPSGRDPGLRTQAGKSIHTTWALLRLCSAEAPSTWDPENQVQAPALPLSHSVAEGRASGPEVPTWPRLPVTLCSGSSAWGPGPQPQSLRRGFWCRQLPEGGARERGQLSREGSGLEPASHHTGAPTLSRRVPFVCPRGWLLAAGPSRRRTGT